MSHDYSQIASELLHSLGGAANVEQAAHWCEAVCAWRSRTRAWWTAPALTRSIW
ncbi:MAG: hypothetical protein ACFWUJ_17920 [Pseudomonas fragi]